MSFLNPGATMSGATGAATRLADVRDFTGCTAAFGVVPIIPGWTGPLFTGFSTVGGDVSYDVYWVNGEWQEFTTSTTLAVWLANRGETVCYVSILHDQSGNGRNATQTVQANMPILDRATRLLTWGLSTDFRWIEMPAGCIPVGITDWSMAIDLSWGNDTRISNPTPTATWLPFATSGGLPAGTNTIRGLPYASITNVWRMNLTNQSSTNICAINIPRSWSVPGVFIVTCKGRRMRMIHNGVVTGEAASPVLNWTGANIPHLMGYTGGETVPYKVRSLMYFRVDVSDDGQV